MIRIAFLALLAAAIGGLILLRPMHSSQPQQSNASIPKSQSLMVNPSATGSPTNSPDTPDLPVSWHIIKLSTPPIDIAFPDGWIALTLDGTGFSVVRGDKPYVIPSTSTVSAVTITALESQPG
jgi:hypothetical protein